MSITKGPRRNPSNLNVGGRVIGRERGVVDQIGTKLVYNGAESQAIGKGRGEIGDAQVVSVDDILDPEQEHNDLK